jgi:hypothetical protein
MDVNSLIPTPDTIPAPAWVFIVLEQLLFLLHIIVINAVLGGALILFFKRIMTRETAESAVLHQPVAVKLPVLFALGINFAIPPLLFLQVVFGHLFYTSSVLMATYWILIIPLLIIAYYGAYIHKSKLVSTPWFSKLSLAVAILILLYTGFMLVGNNALMESPERWTAYFENRGGGVLGIELVTFLPRYFHFIAASIAVGGLFYSVIYKFMKKEVENREDRINNGLKIFALGTSVQVVVGFWYLLAIPQDFMLQFMGKDLIATIFLMVGILAGIGALVAGFMKKFNATVILALLTLVAMIINRYNLRMMYLNDNFQLSQLKLSPQYGVLVLFLLILLIGLAAIFYMIKVGFKNNNGRAAL